MSKRKDNHMQTNKVHVIAAKINERIIFIKKLKFVLLETLGKYCHKALSGNRNFKAVICFSHSQHDIKIF